MRRGRPGQPHESRELPIELPLDRRQIIEIHEPPAAVIERNMDTEAKSRAVPRLLDGGFRVWLAHHQAGAGHDATVVGLEDPRSISADIPKSSALMTTWRACASGLIRPVGGTAELGPTRARLAASTPPTPVADLKNRRRARFIPFRLPIARP